MQDDEARSAAEAFAGAAAAKPEQACALLAPHARSALEAESGKPCSEALSSINLPPSGSDVSVEVASSSAQVVLGTDTIFLARFDQGWRVTAAGCTRDPQSTATIGEPVDTSVPYDCTIKGE